MLLEQSFLALPQTFKEGFAVHGLDLTALDLVITSVETGSHLCQRRDRPGHSFLSKLSRRASGFRNQGVQPRFDIRGKMHFHALRVRHGESRCQAWPAILIRSIY